MYIGGKSMSIYKGKEKVDDYFERIVQEGFVPNEKPQGVSAEDITLVLNRVGKFSADIRDAILCLLDTEFPSLFANSNGIPISAGAGVAHIGGYVGIYLRHGKRLDREGRDYWIKPLRDIGAIEAITYQDRTFVPGHLKAKSPNSAYRLNADFVELLKSVGTSDFEACYMRWVDSTDERLHIIHELQSKESVSSPHKQLILDSIEIYARHFLPGYFPVFTDFEDGNRISDEERAMLEQYGIIFGRIDDVWPDVILFNAEFKSLWFIEAVTTDGEADIHKLEGLMRICSNSNKKYGGVTTTYETWSRCAARQKKEKNLVKGSYVWIREDPTKQFFID